MIAKFNTIVQQLESRVGIVGAGLLLALIQYGIAALYVSNVDFGPGPHGVLYGKLAYSPFNFAEPNEIQLRVLGPILGFLTGLRGNNFTWVPASFAIALLTVSYCWFRRKDLNVAEAVGITALMGFSSILYIHFIALGYVDPISYFWLFLAFAFAKRKPLMALFMALALLTHEANGFLLPGLALYSWQVDGQKPFISKLIGPFLLVICVVPLLIVRHYVTSNTEVLYETEFYLTLGHVARTTKAGLAYIPVGAFYSFKLSWMLVPVAIYLFLHKKEWLKALVIITILVGVTLQATIALDYGRLFDLAFPAIVLSAMAIRQNFGSEHFAKGLWILHGLNFLTLQYYVASDRIYPLFPKLFGWIEDGLNRII